MSFDEWFNRATGNDPFPYQRRFAVEGEIPELVDVATGLGKTAMAVLGWLWRRETRPQDTPRRLVYCLPMRVLVEQTRDNAVLWLHKIGRLAGTAELLDEENGGKRLRSYRLDAIDSSGPNKIAVHVLMGGEDEEDWDIHPEREQIVIGTQDMLLSRALNRGYAATRSRWPIQFGLLNTDCLWVFDEIQLMGAGLATTTQLEAFRRLIPNNDAEGAKNAHGCRSVWMSATMQRGWLATVDFAPFVERAAQLTFEFESEIKAEGLDDKTRDLLRDRWQAKKPLVKATAAMGDAEELAKEVRQAHKPGTRTIAILNTVKRACALFEALTAGDQQSTSEPHIILLHSRFRPGDREKQVARALAEIKPGEPGAIVISTQVIEAGVDVSATTLFTELSPWASLVQRFGRCNRKGESDAAQVFWIDVSNDQAAPYDQKDLDVARKQLQAIERKSEKQRDVGLMSLPRVPLRFDHTHVIRRKDLIDLFDTTPDLAGNDLDIDRFVRDVEVSDVRAFWRDYGETPNETDEREGEATPQRAELCAAPIGSDKNPGFRQFTKKHFGQVWRWNFLDKRWEKADAGKIGPGQVFLIHCEAGGYSPERGWDPDSKERVDAIVVPAGTKLDAPDSTEGEPLSRIPVWQTIAEHADDLLRELDCILNAVPTNEAEALRHAARWHDRGKAHQVFQNAIDDGQVVERKGKTILRRKRPEQWQGCRFIAKAPDKQKNAAGQIVDPGFWKRYDWLPKEGRKHFRHELASALSVLDPRNDKIPDECRDRVAYLVAAHHGKVRLSIRSLPNELRPDGNRRFARGIWDDDELPATDLGGGVIAPAVRLSLEPIELGLCEQDPFAGQPSWIERMIRWRDTLGPFRLAYLEAILRAADMRASRAAEQRSATNDSSGTSHPKGQGSS